MVVTHDVPAVYSSESEKCLFGCSAARSLGCCHIAGHMNSNAIDPRARVR